MNHPLPLDPELLDGLPPEDLELYINPPHVPGDSSARIEYEHRNCIGITRNDAGEFIACLDQHGAQYETEEDLVSIRLDNQPDAPHKCVTCGDLSEWIMCTPCRRNAPEDIGPGRIDYSVKEIR